jgi:hypothetical protein
LMDSLLIWVGVRAGFHGTLKDKSRQYCSTIHHDINYMFAFQAK